MYRFSVVDARGEEEKLQIMTSFFPNKPCGMKSASLPPPPNPSPSSLYTVNGSLARASPTKLSTSDSLLIEARLSYTEALQIPALESSGEVKIFFSPAQILPAALNTKRWESFKMTNPPPLPTPKSLFLGFLSPRLEKAKNSYVSTVFNLNLHAEELGLQGLSTHVFNTWQQMEKCPLPLPLAPSTS